MNTGLNSRAFSALSYALLAITALGAVYMATAGRWISAAGLVGFVALAVAFLLQRDRLPAIFSSLFVLAGLINAAGYAFNLWHNPVWFDELVHFYTSFTVVAAIGWLMFSRTGANAAGHSLRFVASVTGIGIVLGILWEVFEWAIGIIGTSADTVIDLVMDTLGAAAAGLFCASAAARERRHPRAQRENFRNGSSVSTHI